MGGKIYMEMFGSFTEPFRSRISVLGCWLADCRQRAILWREKCRGDLLCW